MLMLAGFRWCWRGGAEQQDIVVGISDCGADAPSRRKIDWMFS